MKPETHSTLSALSAALFQGGLTAGQRAMLLACIRHELTKAAQSAASLEEK